MVVGSVQVGVLAACIVLFLPMGMAGYHLSRNRMLFFGAALFITLAVGVHLMPYFPNFSDIFLSSFTSNSSTKLSFSCLTKINEIDWEEEDGVSENYNSFNNRSGQMGAIGSRSSRQIGTTGANSSGQIRVTGANPSAQIGAIEANSSAQIEASGANRRRTWHWNYQAVSSGCSFQELARADALDLLNGSWIVVAGDSEARFLVLSLLELVLESTEPIRKNLFKRHSDFEFFMEERRLKLDFIWAPFASNLTRFLRDLRRGGVYPDVLVMGTGLWHMLYVTNAIHYGEGLRRVQNLVDALLPLSSSSEGFGGIDAAGAVQAPHMFWIGLPTLVNSMLNSEAKRQRMTREMCAAYTRELEKSKLLWAAGGPLVLLDIGGLSQGCGPSCTDDGMHYKSVVYEAAVQVMLNALLIESQQQPSG